MSIDGISDCTQNPADCKDCECYGDFSPVRHLPCIDDALGAAEAVEIYADGTYIVNDEYCPDCDVFREATLKQLFEETV